MALCLARNFCYRAINFNPSQLNSSRYVSLKVVKNIPPPQNERYDERGARFKRPISPHLSIYQPQITSVLSISHRMTGVALSAYIIGAGITGLMGGDSSIISTIEGWQLGAASLTALKFSIAFPFVYHYFNGIRHLLWDVGFFLNVKEIYVTGYAVLFATFIATIALTFYF
ncbi:hypothetical protein PVAND_017501 [Polypedilum vanderplanki]|uniref:Succinate dehydrogenase cytochrome b560 subunit, mitochondrial n=1 Tax=Polypedilum vanderplanki TaxID=319348 RepID=A0A9J6BIV9_POLVA|nr:hypothetical protein PVAND_017501 [Polypedilum vanderplanki]